MKNEFNEKKLKEELLYSVRTKRKNDIIQLLEKGADPNTRDDYRTTILMHAAENGWEDIVELLIKKGADVNMQNLKDTTALRKAINHELKEETSYNICKMLIDAKADLNLIDRTRCSPLIWAVCYGQTKTVQLLLDNGANPDVQTVVISKTALMFATYQGYEDITKALLDKKAQINIKSSNGSTALLDAIEQGHFDLAKTLLKAGANPNLLGGEADQRTPLMAAIASRNLELTKSLVKDYGADINIANNHGWTATTYAISTKDTTDYLKYILQYNPIINQQNDTGSTNLMHAVALNEPKMVDMLLQNKADTNLQDNEGRTALMSAVRLLQNPEEIAYKLMQKGANPNIKDDNGKTALDIFMSLGRDNENLVSLLTKGYAKIQAQATTNKQAKFRSYLRQNRNNMKS